MDLGAVHFHIKGPLHGENLLSGKSRFRANPQALLCRKHAGRDSGRIAQSFCKAYQFFAAGRYQDVSRNSRQKGARLTGIGDIDKCIIFLCRMVLLAVKRIPCQYFSLQVQIRKAGLSASRLNLPGDDLRMRVRRVDHTGKRPFPHHLCHPAAVEPPLMDYHEGMGRQDLLAVPGRHTHSAGNACRQQFFRRSPSFCCPTENQNASVFSFHLSEHTFLLPAVYQQELFSPSAALRLGRRASFFSVFMYRNRFPPPAALLNSRGASPFYLRSALSTHCR